MGRRIGGFVAGLVAGFIAVAAVEAISSILHPLPEGFDPYTADVSEMAAFVATLPPLAFVLLLVAHVLGAFVAAFTCEAIVRERWWPGSLAFGLLFLAAGIWNLVQIPHPVWFAVLDVLAYVPSALIGGWLAGRLFVPRADAKVVDA